MCNKLIVLFKHYAPLCFVGDCQQKHFCHLSLISLREFPQLCQPCPSREASGLTRALRWKYNKELIPKWLKMARQAFIDTYRGVSRTNKGTANMIWWKSFQSPRALSSEGIIAPLRAVPRALVSGATERLLLGIYSKTIRNEMLFLWGETWIDQTKLNSPRTIMVP